jgi:hypothetical protein
MAVAGESVDSGKAKYKLAEFLEFRA